MKFLITNDMIQINNDLRDRAYKCACEHGFHEVEQYDSFYLALIMSEIGEAINADRHNKHADLPKYVRTWIKFHEESNFWRLNAKQKKTWIKKLFVGVIKDTVEDELADIAIRILDLAGLREYDITVNADIELAAADHANILFMQFCYTMFNTLSNDDQETEEKLKYAMLFLQCYCVNNNINLGKHIDLKMMYNEMRPRLNGKEY